MSTDEFDDSRRIAIELRRCKQNTDAVSRVTAEFTIIQVISCLSSQINSETCTEKLESALEGFCSILATSQQCWLQCTEESDQLLDAYNDLVRSCINYANLPTKMTNEDEEYIENLMKCVPKKASVAFKMFTAILCHCRTLSDDDEHFNKNFIRTNAADFVILSARHAEIHNWSNETTRQQSSDFQDLLCECCHSSSLQQLFRGTPEDEDSQGIFRKGIFSKILVKLRQHLTRDTWKVEPSSRHVFKWCLFHVKHPYLGDYLDGIFPPALLFLDDYQVENKILGILCLHHIITNVNPTELKWYGRAMVIYEALYKQLYSQEIVLLDVLLPCVVDLMGVIERSPRKADEPRNINRYDDVFHILLSNMEFEQKITLRRVYAKYLHLFVERMGITVVKHYKRLFRIITQYLEVYDGPDEVARIRTLVLLSVLIRETWPRISRHVDELLKSLLKLIYDITVDETTTPDTVNQVILDGCTECLVLLWRCCPEVEQKLTEVMEVTDNEAVLRCIGFVLSDRNHGNQQTDAPAISMLMSKQYL